MPTGPFPVESIPQLALALSCFAAALVAAIRFPDLMVAAVLGLGLLAQSILFSFDPSSRDDTVSIYATDVIALSLCTVAVCRLVRRRPLSVAVVAATALGMLVIVGVTLWAVQLDLESAKAWRYWLAMVAVALWGVTSPTGWTKRTGHVVVGFAVAVAVAQAVGFAIYGFHGYDTTLQAGDVVRSARPVSANLALGMTVGVCVLWHSRSRWAVWQVLLASALLVSILLSQHRSVWLATIAALAVLIGYDWLSRHTRFRAVIVSCAASVIVALTVLVGFAGTPLESAASDKGTLLWRVDGWTASLGVERTPAEWLYGGVLGPTPIFAPPPSRHEALLPGTHSTYVGAVHIVGVIGLIALLVLLLSPLARRSSASPHFAVAAAVTASVLVYGVFYLPTIWSMLLVGLMCAKADVAQYAPLPPSTAPAVLARINRSSVSDQFST